MEIHSKIIAKNPIALLVCCGVEVLHEYNVLIMLLSIEDELVFVHDTCMHNSFSCFVLRRIILLSFNLQHHPFCDLATVGCKKAF